MNVDHLKERLQGAMHRGHGGKATEEELGAVAALVLAVVGEVTAELAIVITELANRVEALEAAAGA
jgi:hypothetical protein